jgi:hypothetical protein
MPIGPSLPPHLAHLSAASTSRSPSPDSKDAESDVSDNDFGPALPPHLAAARNAGPSRPNVIAPPSPPPTLGPAIPDFDDDDDDIGPKLTSVAPAQSAAQEFLEREERWAKEREEAKKPKKLEREEWMLVPPTSGVLASGKSHIVPRQPQSIRLGNVLPPSPNQPRRPRPTRAYGQKHPNRKLRG